MIEYESLQWALETWDPYTQFSYLAANAAHATRFCAYQEHFLRQIIIHGKLDPWILTAMISRHASLSKSYVLNAPWIAKASARRLLTAEGFLSIESVAWNVVRWNEPLSFLWSANDHGSLPVPFQVFLGWKEDLEWFSEFYFSISLDLTS